MDPRQVRELLERVRASDVSVEDAIESLQKLPFRDLGFANVDHHRALRQGMPEVIFGLAKTAEAIAALETLAKIDPKWRLSLEARAALARMSRRP